MALDVQRIPIEIQFAQGLAGNEQKNRDKTLALLKKFIRLRLPRLKEQLKEDEFIKLWKGMHYQLWMQDKPLIQEKLVDDLCELVHDFPNEAYTLMFIKAFFDTEAREWFGLDQWRMNKFMMLVREFLHNSFLFLKNYDWKESVCECFSGILEESVMNCRNIDLPIGLKLHLMDIFLYELEKVADDKLSPDTAVILLSPFLNTLTIVKNGNVMKKLLTLLFEAGGGQECPKEVFSKDSKDSEDEADGFVDRKPPRVKGNKVQFNKELLLKKLMEKGASKKCPAKNRSQIYKLIKRIRYFEMHPQKPVKLVKAKDINLNDVEVPQRAILAAVKRLKKNKDDLLEKVPLRKEYKINLLMEKKSKKSSTEIDINEADTEEEEDGGIDMEGLDEEDDDADSLDYDPETEFFQMSTESDDETGVLETGADVDDLSGETCLPNGHVEDESAESGIQESPTATKKNKKSKKAGSKRKSDESVEESAAPALEKKAKKAEKGKKKKVDNVAAEEMEVAVPEEMEVIVPEEMEMAVPEEMVVAVPEEKKKSKKKKQKTKKKSEKTGISETGPLFGMVDFPDEENSLTECLNEAEVVMFEMAEPSEEESSKSEEKATTSKKVKKLKLTKKSKKTKVTKEPPQTNDQSEKTADCVPFPLPTDAIDSVDVTNIESQNTLQLFEHLKKLKEEKDKHLGKSKKKAKSSPFDRYFNLVKKEVDSIEEQNKTTSNAIEAEAAAKDSSEDKMEEAAVPVDEAEVPVTKEKTSKKGKKKLSLLVKSKSNLIIKGQTSTLVERKSEKPDLESDSSEELDKLYEQPPAFLRNAVAKAGKSKKEKKSKKGKKSKKSKTEDSASPQKTPTASASPGEKRVSFNMEQNKALAFLVGTRITNDENAFQPSKMPENGILKPSPSPIRVSKKFTMDKKLSMLAKPSFMAHFF